MDDYCDVILNANNSITVKAISFEERKERYLVRQCLNEEDKRRDKLLKKVAAGLALQIPKSDYCEEYILVLDPSSRNVYDETGIKKVLANYAVLNDYESFATILSKFLKDSVFWLAFERYIFYKPTKEEPNPPINKHIIKKYGLDVVNYVVKDLFWKLKAWTLDWLRQMNRNGLIYFKMMYAVEILDIDRYIDYLTAETITDGKSYSEEERIMIREDFQEETERMLREHDFEYIDEESVRPYEEVAITRMNQGKTFPLSKNYIMTTPDLRKQYYTILDEVFRAGTGMPVKLVKRVCSTSRCGDWRVSETLSQVKFWELFREREKYAITHAEGMIGPKHLAFASESEYEYDWPEEKQQEYKDLIFQFYDEFLCYRDSSSGKKIRTRRDFYDRS